MTAYKPHWHMNTVRTILGLVLVAIVMYAVMPTTISYATDAPPLTPRGMCSNDPDFEIGIGGGGGLVTGIISLMQSVLNSVTQTMYNNIIGNGGYGNAVKAAAILYIVMYGIAFTIGATALTASDIVVRVVKVWIIATVLSPASWAFFNSTVVTFFNQGTDELINLVSNIAAGGRTLGGYPFAPLDAAIQKILSSKMLVTLWSLVSPIPPYAPAGPNGMIVGILLLSGLGSFMRAVSNAIWVYMMALVLKALLFGVAPLFIPFILFSRTRHLFDGWLNQVVNASLQPIMLFTFFSFFVILVSVMVDKILMTPVCWTGWNDGVRGAPFIEHWWRFTVFDPEIGTYVPYTGIWSFTGAASAGAPTFPLDIGLIIMFMMVAELAVRFNAVVIEIAKDISGAATDLSGAAGSMNDWFMNNNPLTSSPTDPGRLGGGTGGPPGKGGLKNGLFGKGGLGGLFSKGGMLEGASIKGAAKTGAARSAAAKRAATARTGTRVTPTGAPAAASAEAAANAAATTTGTTPGGVAVSMAPQGKAAWNPKLQAPSGSLAENLRDNVGSFLTGSRGKV